MIGRTLDRIIECATCLILDKPGSTISDGLRAIALPIEKRNYGAEYNDDGSIKRYYTFKDFDSNGGWGNSEPDGQIKRDCARAFEKRRKAKVGGYFDISNWHYGCLGTAKFSSSVHRVERNAVTFRGFVISSSRKILLKYRQFGYNPVLYRGVIW